MMASRAKSLVAALRSSALVFRLAQVGLLGGLVALSLSLTFNASPGPDEVAHYFFIRYIAAHGRLPLTDAERLEAGYKADLPPLFYLLAGLPVIGLNLNEPPRLKTNRDDLRLNLITGPKNISGWRLIKTEDPYRGEVLLWAWGRWFTLITGVVALALTYGLARFIAPPHPWLALAATALVAFLPTYVNISSVTNYEPLTAALMAGYGWLLCATLISPRPVWRYFGLGLVLGLAAATRQTVWPLLPVVPALALWLACRQRWGWATLGRQVGGYALGVLLTFGAWLAYLLVFFNRIAERGWLMGLLSPILVGDGSGHTSLQIANVISAGQIGSNGPAARNDTLWQWGAAFFTGMWGSAGWFWFAALLWLAIGAGLVYGWRQRREGWFRLGLTLLLLQGGLLLLFPLLRFLFSGSAEAAVSRHFLFPAAAMLVALLVLGASAWSRLRPYFTGVMLLLAAVYLAQDVRQVYHDARAATAFPVQTVPVALPEPRLADFDAIVLMQADLAPSRQTLQVTLRWRAEQLSNQDDRLEVTLLDAANTPQARWVGQPVNGRYPTRAWLPGDRVRDEISLPVAGLTAGDYRVRLRLFNDDGPIPAKSGREVELGPVALNPAPASAAGQLALAAAPLDYTLWPPDGSTGLPLFKENQAIVFTINPAPVAAGLQLALVGPDGTPRPPADCTGHTVIFTVAPDFAAGPYRLRALLAGAQAESADLLQVETAPRKFTAGPVATPLAANFAGYVSLLGYNLPAARLHPGEALPVTLYWQAQRAIGADLVVFNHLIGPDGQQWGGQDRRPRDVYSTLLWAPREVVEDAYAVTISPTAPAGEYYLLVGLYLPVGQSAVSLPLVQSGRQTDVTHVAIGPIEVVANDSQP